MGISEFLEAKGDVLDRIVELIDRERETAWTSKSLIIYLMWRLATEVQSLKKKVLELEKGAT